MVSETTYYPWVLVKRGLPPMRFVKDAVGQTKRVSGFKRILIVTADDRFELNACLFANGVWLDDELDPVGLQILAWRELTQTEVKRASAFVRRWQPGGAS